MNSKQTPEGDKEEGKRLEKDALRALVQYFELMKKAEDTGHFDHLLDQAGWNEQARSIYKMAKEIPAASSGEEKRFTLKEALEIMLEGEVVGEERNVIKRKKMRQKYFKDKFGITI